MKVLFNTVLFLLLFFSSFSQTLENISIEDFSTRENIQIPMNDGVLLSTDIWLPITSENIIMELIMGEDSLDVIIIPQGIQLLIYPEMIDEFGDTVSNPNPYKLPMIFTRTPYNKQSGGGGEFISMLGYAYVLQDIRGRYDSQGAYIPMFPDGWKKTPYINTQHILDVTDPASPQNANLHQDGVDSYNFLLNELTKPFDLNGDGNYDTIDSYFSGSIGMVGASALGNTQYQLAAAKYIDPDAPGLKALLPIVATNEHYNTTAYNNGVFREALTDGWVTSQLEALDDELINYDTTIFNNIHTAADYNQPDKETVIKLAIDHFCVLKYDQQITSYYPNSIFRSNMDASFAPLNELGEADANGNVSRYTNMNVPAYHLTGWYDIFIDGQIQTFNLMRNHTVEPASSLQKLVIGPWAHQTVGQQTTGDMTYKENVLDIASDIVNMDIGSLINSETFAWFRDRLNYNGYVQLTEPIFRIPEGEWQYFPNGIEIKVPSENYDISYIEFLNFLNGSDGLNQMPVEIVINSEHNSFNFNLPPLENPVTEGEMVTEIPKIDFNEIPDIRFYVIGPVDDGIPENENTGNYWFQTDSFPLSEHKIDYLNLYMHQNGTLDTTMPVTDEGFKYYINDPDNPWHGWSVGGNNMRVKTPQNDRNSQGQFNLADPLYAPYALENPGIISFTSQALEDTMSFIGFPKAVLYAKVENLQATEGVTDCDFFVRIVDVYPDGREMFITEGAINARARKYAKSLYHESENINAPFSNINFGEVYEFKFNILPIAYTLGIGHKIKVLIQSKNYPRYQSNPQVPIEDGSFFRRKPMDGQTYFYQGVEYEPRTLNFFIAFSPEHPSHISLPVFNNIVVGKENLFLAEKNICNNIKIYPNPSDGELFIKMKEEGETNIKIFNASGKIVKCGNYDTRIVNVNMNNFPKGIYIVKVKKNGEIYSEKIILN